MKTYTVYQTVENLLGINTSHFVGCFFSEQEALDVLTSAGEFFEYEEDYLVGLYKDLGRYYEPQGCIFELWEYDGVVGGKGYSTTKLWSIHLM